MDVNRVSTTAEVAEALGLSPATVQGYARDGLVPFDSTPGGHRRFDIEEVRTALVAAAENRRHKQPKKQPATQVLVCAVCLYVSEEIAEQAVTVIAGLAVCEDHSDMVHDDQLSRIIVATRGSRR